MTPNNDQLTRAFFRLAAVIVGLFAFTPGPVIADNYAVTSGNWSSAATWSNGVPTIGGPIGFTDISSIGAYSPGARTATVTLSQNSAANFLTLGDGSGNSGTLDLRGFNLTANYLYLGNGGSATLLRTGGGTLTISPYGHLYVNYGSFVFAPGDTAAQLDLSSYYGTTATTAATGNITNVASVPSGTTLNLGANLSLSSITNVPGNLSLSGTLNANGYAINAPTVGLNTPFMLTNRGPIAAGTVTVDAGNSASQASFNLIAADAVTTFNLNGANTIFPSGASVQNLNLQYPTVTTPPTGNPPNSTATTSAPGNVTGSVSIGQGNSLTLGANLSLTGTLNLRGSIAANGYAISANQILIPYYTTGYTVTNRGAISAGTLDVTVVDTSARSFNLAVGDVVTTFNLRGVTTSLPAAVTVQNLNLYANGTSAPIYYGAATTSAAGNVTHNVYLDFGTMVTQGASLNLSNTLSVFGTLNANGYAVTAATIDIGSTSGAATFQNAGPVMASTWNQGNSTRVQFPQPGDALGSILLSSSSALTIADAAGQLTGLTVTSQATGAISIDSTSDLILDLNGQASGWIFRWANPAGGDHIADLEALINHEITFFSTNGGFYSVTSDGSYTYINVIPVPEPSAMALSLAVTGVLAVSRRRRVGTAARIFPAGSVWRSGH